jgi:hypothetical protein
MSSMSSTIYVQVHQGPLLGLKPTYVAVRCAAQAAEDLLALRVGAVTT